MFKEVVKGIRIKLPKGRPRTRPEELLADSAYDTKEIRNYLRNRGIQSNIPGNRRNTKTPGPGRPTRFEDRSYKDRGAVERFFAWLLSFKRIIIRHERLVKTYQAFINIASILILWRVLKWVHNQITALGELFIEGKISLNDFLPHTTTNTRIMDATYFKREGKKVYAQRR